MLDVSGHVPLARTCRPACAILTQPASGPLPESISRHRGGDREWIESN